MLLYSKVLLKMELPLKTLPAAGKIKGQKHMLFLDARMLTIFALSPLRPLAQPKKSYKSLSLIDLIKAPRPTGGVWVETRVYRAFRGNC